MPMLAERRRKTKWANPGRQALWKRDSGDAAFGREMMEKMGWKVGQGLGANEQGIKEPLKISFKNDNKGVGFKDNDNEWIQQQSEFDEFLNKLSSEKEGLSKDSQTNTVQSLEERSRLSKARVHYHKFTRGKDLTKYSKRDLECILGRNEKESSEISGNMGSCNENIRNEDKTLISAGSMADYFAKKFQSKRKNKDDCLNIMDPQGGESLLEDRSKGETEENLVESTMDLEDKRKKKSKKKKEKDEGDCMGEPFDERNIDNSDHKMESPEGSKRSKKTEAVQENDHSSPLDDSKHCENETTETELIEMKKEKETENMVESTMESHEKKKKKSKKKKEKDEDGCIEGPCDERDINNRDYNMDSFSERGKKSKKTKILQENDQLNPLNEGRGCENETTETVLIGMQKEKEEKEIENMVDSTTELHENRKKKSKKKKGKDEGGCIEGPCDKTDINTSDHKMESSEGSKRSKKTKIDQENYSSPLDSSKHCENESTETELTRIPKEEDIENVVESTTELQEKRNKKSKKKKVQDEGDCIEGPFDDRNIDNSDHKIESSEGSKRSKKTKLDQENGYSSPLGGSKHCENESTETELTRIPKEEVIENVVESTTELQEKRGKKSKKKKEKDEGDCIEGPCDERDINYSDYKMDSFSERGKKSKKTKTVPENDPSSPLDRSNGCENETTETELIGMQKEKEEKEIENKMEPTMELHEKRKKKSKKKKEVDEGGCIEEPCDKMDINTSDHKLESSERSKKRKKTKILEEHDKSNVLDGSKCYEIETAKTESIIIQKEEEEEEENVNGRNLEGDGVPDEKIKKKKKKRKKEENLVEHFDTENVEAVNVFENKGGECKETQEKGDSVTSAEEVTKKKKTSKRDHRVIIDEDDEGDAKEKVKKKKRCLEAENRFNYEDYGTNENDLDPVSHTETDYKKEKAKRKTKCESALGNKQGNKKIGREEEIAGEDPLAYKVELLKKENSLKGTTRNKLLNLIYSTNIEQFSGSNLGGLSGYGIVSHR